MKKAAPGIKFVNSVHESPISEADARIFLSVVQAGSFVAAAEAHSMTPSAVSKAVSRLEGGLGVRLLTRTTRKLNLTDEGAIFAEKAATAFALLAEAAEQASASTRSIAGHLRIGMPPLFGTYLVAPLLPALLARHPRLRVEIKTLSRLSDFTQAGIDCAIAVGDLPDSSFAARPMGHGLFVTVASPAYLEAEGTPSSVADLQRHRRIGFVRADGREHPWVFSDEAGGVMQFEAQGHVRTDEMHHLGACALAGLGIAQLPMFVIAHELASGRLARLLERQEAPGKLASIVYPAGRALPRRTRVFIDFLLSQTGDLPGVRRADR